MPSSLLGRAAGYPDYSSEGQGHYTPELYARKTLIKLYKSTILSDITNTEYEGELRAKGDTIIIRTVPDVTIRDYVKGQDLVYESPDSASIEMTIDKAKYYATKIDRIDELQNDINQMERWTEDAAQQLKITIENAFFTDLFKTNYATTCATGNIGVAASGLGGVTGSYYLGDMAGAISTGSAAAKILKISAGTTSGTSVVNAVDFILGLSSVLTEQNVPETDRWCVIPPWMVYKLQTSELRRADGLGAPDNKDVLRRGKIGVLGNMNIYVSNNLPQLHATGPAFPVPFGHKMALSFATQLTETEMLPHPLAFGKIMRGLQVYGYKSIKPEAVGVAAVCKID